MKATSYMCFFLIREIDNLQKGRRQGRGILESQNFDIAQDFGILAWDT